MQESKANPRFPSLPLEAWEDAKITLHLWLQIVGKVQLDLMPRRNHWWNITFLVGARGLKGRPVPHEKGTFEFEFDFQQHAFVIHTSWGERRSFPLEDGLSVASFHAQFFKLLDSLDIKTKIIPVPYDHPCKEAFHECETHHSYNPEYVHRFWQVIVTVDHIFKKFAGGFIGKVSPSQLYWHHMDLAVTRFSGKAGPKLPASSTKADKEAYSHEVISAGFWAGDEQVRGAAFYSYTYPSPDGLDQATLQPSSAQWVDANGSPMATLMYDDLIKSDDPERDLLAFLQSSYDAGATLANWPADLVAD